MKTVLGLICAIAQGQVVVSMDLVPQKSAAAELSRGEGAYTWNITACPAGPEAKLVPFEMARFEFPEVGLLSEAQVEDILARRVEKSPARRWSMAMGFAGAATGVAVQVKNTLAKSPSQLGSGITFAGIALAIAPGLLPKAPVYQIKNRPPAQLGGSCGTFTWLAHYGKAPQTVGPRRVDPMLGDPLKK